MIFPLPQTEIGPFIVPPNALGVDVSHWQGVMDWDKCAAAGAEFAVIRAGSINNVTGECYYDYQFPNNAEEAPKRMPTWAYWFFRPSWGPIKQADFFADLIEMFPALLPIPVADCEAFDGTTANAAAVSIAAFLDRLDTRLKPLHQPIYTRQSVWDSHVAYRSFWPLYHLHAARYANWLTSPWSDGSYVFRDWSEWTFWQFSADGNGRGAEFGAESNSIDLNYFNGDSLDLMLYLELDKPPTPEPPPVPGLQMVVTAAGLNVRSEPRVANNKVGTLVQGDRLAVLDVASDENKQWGAWVLHDKGGWSAVEYQGKRYMEPV